MGKMVTEHGPTSGTRAQTAFDQRFASVKPRLLAICRGLVGGDLADDVVHDTYIRGRSRFHQLRDPARFDAWVSRMAVNLCFNCRRERRHSSDRAAIERTVSLTASMRDVGLRELIELLPPRERTLVVLHYGYGYPIGDIAALLDTSLGNARSLLFRARAKLGKQLREAEQ